MSEEKPRATFVTFYSFKGGVGRSMALINTAGILAGQRGFRVLVIDVDLEAPGLSYLDPSAPDESPAHNQRELPFESGFVDLLTDAKLRGEAADLFNLSPEALAEKYTKVITIPQESREFPDGFLRVMPAGKLDATYAMRLNALNIGDLYRAGFGEPLIRTFKKKIAESGLYDYVLVDSRTGLSDEAGMCTRDLADHLMILSGLNRQNVEGTSEFLRALRTATESKKTLQIILSPVPNGEDKLADEREKIAGDAFSEAWKAKIDLSLQIPYHPQLALTEEPHIFRRRKGYLFESYRAIERSMLRMLEHTAQAFYRRAFALLRKKEHVAVLRELQHMIRLEGGREMLSRLADEISYPEMGRVQSSEDATRTPVTVDTLLKEPGGLSILAFIVEGLPVGEHAWASRTFVVKLWSASPELADTLYRRLVDAAPDDADLLGSYAFFLATMRLGLDATDALDAADAYYQRALEADPKHADNLGNYAIFLKDRRGNLDAAESYYQRALEADPKHASSLASYAIFLANRRGDLDAAEGYYVRALETEPKNSNNLANYGQLLVAKGRFEEGQTALLAALDLQPQEEKGNVAELLFSLWLVARIQGRDGERWERQFKSLIAEGFDRHPWSFDRMLERASGVLSVEEFAYAQALAAAFLDAEKLANLESFLRWTALEALAPNPPKAKRQRRKATS